MGHTPFGYRIENGTAVIDKPTATKLRQLYKNYLSGMSLSKAAAEAGIPTYHGTAKRLMETAHYLGDDFYPSIIDKDTYQNAHFYMKDGVALHDNPVRQAEYLYSLIESESQ